MAIISDRNLKFETLQLHTGQEYPDPTTGARAVPIYETTSFVFKDTNEAENRFNLTDDGNIYSRVMNPTNDVLEKRLTKLEGGSGALVTSSGAAATTFAIQNIMKQGDHLVCSQNVYGGTYNLFAQVLPQYGITTTFVNSDEVQNFENAIAENTKAIFIETLGNPNSTVIDIEEVAKIAHKNKIPLIVDNTFATPYLLRPIEHGADIVIHSATKFIGGHGTTIGGVIIDGGQFDWEASGKFPCLTEPNESYHGHIFTKISGNAVAYITKARITLMRDIGAALSPFNSFLLLQGLETLSLRVERHIENTIKIIDYLKTHPKVEKINHPYLEDSPYNMLFKKYFKKNGGSIFTIEIKGGAHEARKFIDHLELFSLLANVADSKSLVIHPATTTHSQMSEAQRIECGILQNTVRLSIGLEHVDDLIFDIENALNKISE